MPLNYHSEPNSLPQANEGASGSLVGRVLAERFMLDKVVGTGAMGTVYQARQLDLDRTVAIKVLHNRFARRDDMRARFLREARTASLLSHRGCVTVHDFGEWDGHLCIAMEYLRGQTLGQLLADAFPLPKDRVVDLMGQLCDVLHAAHRLDLLHRDLKPENILITRAPNGREVLKVVDFGLAILLDHRSDLRITQDGSLAGTPVYMSPEQALLKDLDHKSDLYAFGCILYEVLCGLPPFRGRSSVDIFSKHLYHDPVPPIQRARAGTVDPALSDLALWALEKEPTNRPETAGLIAERIRASLAENPTGPVSEREFELHASNRHERVNLAGIRPLTQRMPRPMLELRGAVALVQSDRLEHVVTGRSVLESNGFSIDRHLQHDSLHLVDSLDVDAIVFDLRPQVDAALVQLADLMAGVGSGTPVVVIGPGGSFEAISTALSSGASDYIAEASLAKLPQKLARAIRRGPPALSPR